VGQQEIDRGWPETHQRFVCPYRIVAQVDRREQTAEKVPEAWLGEGSKPGPYGRIAAPPSGVATVKVIARCIAVQADPDQYAQLVEEAQETVVEKRSVSLQVNGEFDPGIDGGTDGIHRITQVFRPGEQWFAAVEYHLELGEAVGSGVISDSRRHHVKGVDRHQPGSAAPALVGHFIHVAVVARQIAATMDLDDELPKWRRPPPVAQQGRNI
jgi:hypothetical protein